MGSWFFWCSEDDFVCFPSTARLPNCPEVYCGSAGYMAPEPCRWTNKIYTEQLERSLPRGGGSLHCDHFDIDFPGPIAVAEHPFEPAILWFRAPHRFGSRDLMYSSDFSHCFLSGNPLSCTSWTTPVNKKFGNLPSKKLRMVPCKLSRPFYDIKLSFSNAQKEDF